MIHISQSYQVFTSINFDLDLLELQIPMHAKVVFQCTQNFDRSVMTTFWMVSLVNVFLVVQSNKLFVSSHRCVNRWQLRSVGINRSIMEKHEIPTHIHNVSLSHMLENTHTPKVLMKICTIPLQHTHRKTNHLLIVSRPNMHATYIYLILIYLRQIYAWHMLCPHTFNTNYARNIYFILMNLLRPNMQYSTNIAFS